MQPSSLSCPICSTTNPPQADYCRACGYALQSHTTPSVFNTGTGQLLPRSLLNKRYRILRPIGQGGMGAVYEAEDTQLGNRKVALKEMRQSGLTPLEIVNAANSFRQEALLLAALQNPHLPNIYDHFSEFGRWYLVMSFIHGGTLEERLKKSPNERLPVAEALQIGIQLCTVLGYLHSQQPPIIFRDLKPSNIMYTTDEHIYLIDFGIARLFKPGQAKDTSLYASIGYASPEQYGKAQTNPQSDIYSLGVVLYQILSGYHPSATPFRLPSLQNSGQPIPQDLIRLIEEMTNLDEGKRPASVLIIKQKLQAIAAGPAAMSPLPPTVLNKNPLPPTVPAQSPVVSFPSVSRTPVSSPYGVIQAPAPPVKKSVRPWRLNRKQLIATLVGIVLLVAVEYIFVFPLSSYAFVYYNNPNNPYYLSPLFYGAIFSVILFFAIKFGPWVGLMIGLLGAFIGNSILTRFFQVYPLNEGDFIELGVLGFVCGLAFIVSRGSYTTVRNVVIAIVMSFLGLLTFPFLLRLFDGLQDPPLLKEFSNFDYYYYFFQYGIIPLILVPILLVIISRIEKRNVRRPLPPP